MIQKLEVTNIPASELEHAHLFEISLLHFSTLNLHHIHLGKKYIKLNDT